MKTSITRVITVLTATAFSALAQTNNSATPPAPVDVAASEDFWKWLIGGAAALLVGVAVYFIRRKKAA